LGPIAPAADNPGEGETAAHGGLPAEARRERAEADGVYGPGPPAPVLSRASLPGGGVEGAGDLT